MTTNKLIQVTNLVLLMGLIFTSCEKLNLKKVSASFWVDKEAGYQPLVVKFNNTSENAVDYSWDFGDGTTSTETEPTHTFTTISITGSQTFIVALTATGAKNSTSISTKEINVNREFWNSKPPVFNQSKTYGLMNDQQGNYYRTIVIGNQTWTAQNLRTTKYNDGTDIPEEPDFNKWLILITGAYCNFNPELDDNKIATYGRLYNWFAISTGKLAPAGWHVATQADWETLINYLGGYAMACNKIMEAGNTHCFTENPSTNESGFTAIPLVYISAVYMNILGGNDSCKFWSSSENNDEPNEGLGFLFELGYDVIFEREYKQSGLPIRLVKD